jgi:hypothetical protein
VECSKSFIYAVQEQLLEKNFPCSSFKRVEGRSEEADAIFNELHYTSRLASAVLNYSWSSSLSPSQKPPFMSSNRHSHEDPPCRIFDNFLNEQELRQNTGPSVCRSTIFLLDPAEEGSGEMDGDDETLCQEFGFLGCLIRRTRHQLSQYWKPA